MANKYFKYTFIFFLFGTLIGIMNLASNVEWKVSDSNTNIIFSGFQLLLTLVLFFIHISGLKNYENLKDISVKPIDIMSKAVKAEVINQIFNKSRNTLRLCSNIWLSIILVWGFLYSFMFLYGFGIINLTLETKNLVLRTINHVDSFQMICLYTIFSYSYQNIRFKIIFKRNIYFFYFLVFLFVVDWANHFLFSFVALSKILTYTVAIISSMTFLLFFARLDSILIQLQKPLLYFLIMYGIFQSTYPLIFSNILDTSEIFLAAFVIGLIVSIIAKVGLAILFANKKHLERLVYYFSSIYFLAPITRKQLSVGHTFYAAKFASED